MKTCTHTNCNYPVFSKGLCMNHWRSSEYNKPLAKTKYKPVYSTKAIKAVSTRQQRLNTAYAAQRKVFLKSRPVCEAALTNCTFVATTVHHKKGRGSYLLDESTWSPCCVACHQWIESHPAEAKIRGLSLDRLTI
jgi:hypothetical protein